MLRFARLPSSSLKVSGDDRTSFLMGQMTANLKNLPEYARVPALFLNVKGQIEFYSQIYKRPNDYYIHLPEDLAPQLAQRFQKYIVFDQVEVQDTTKTLATLHLWGEGVENFLPLTADTCQLEVAEGLTVLVSKIRRGLTLGLDVHVLKNKLLDLLDLWNLPETAYEELAMERIVAGLPEPYIDEFLGYLPQECGMEFAVSYQKGCYIGQEIMARIEARGNARYHLVRLTGEDLPDFSPILVGDKSIGKTGLSLRDTCLAVLRKDAPEPSELHFGEAGGQAVRVQIL